MPSETDKGATSNQNSAAMPDSTQPAPDVGVTQAVFRLDEAEKTVHIAIVLENFGTAVGTLRAAMVLSLDGRQRDNIRSDVPSRLDYQRDSKSL